MDLQPRVAWQPQNAAYWNEKEIKENGVDIRSYDPEINFIEDNTIIDGCFEDEKYWGHRFDDIRNWLAVEPLFVDDFVCSIGFRAGEFKTVPDLFLPKSYWDEAISIMRKINPSMSFVVHTDDVVTAKEFFPDFECIHNVGINWRAFRYSKYSIISNSAFYIMPSLLNQKAEKIIAPRYWARRNIKTWARPACYYKDKRFMYI